MDEDRNLGWRDVLDAAREIYTTVNPPATNPPVVTQIPQEEKPSTMDNLLRSPAVLLGGAAVLVIGLVLILKR